MLQSIFRRTVYKNLLTVLITKCSTKSGKLLRKEINQVTLIGTVARDQLKNEYGGKLIYVKTIESGSEKHQIHTLYTSVPQDYVAGQRVFVGGTLTSKEMMTSENKRRHQSIIKAYQIYALNSVNEDETKSVDDINAVELLPTVCADIVEKDDHSIITVATHFLDKFNQKKRPSFHSILVFDPDLREIICRNLEKSDRIYVRGSLRSHSNIDANGKKYSCGFIVAETIHKLTKFYQNRPAKQESATVK